MNTDLHAKFASIDISGNTVIIRHSNDAWPWFGHCREMYRDLHIEAQPEYGVCIHATKMNVVYAPVGNVSDEGATYYRFELGKSGRKPEKFLGKTVTRPSTLGRIFGHKSTLNHAVIAPFYYETGEPTRIKIVVADYSNIITIEHSR